MPATQLVLIQLTLTKELAPLVSNLALPASTALFYAPAASPTTRCSTPVACWLAHQRVTFSPMALA